MPNANVLVLVTDKDYVDKRIHTIEGDVREGDVREGDNVLLEKKKENKQSLSFEKAPPQTIYMYIQEFS